VADGLLVEMGAENPVNPKMATFLVFTFAALGIPPNRLAIGHQIGISPPKATAR
jgi:hypothetical protein